MPSSKVRQHALTSHRYDLKSNLWLKNFIPQIHHETFKYNKGLIKQAFTDGIYGLYSFAQDTYGIFNISFYLDLLINLVFKDYILSCVLIQPAWLVWATDISGKMYFKIISICAAWGIILHPWYLVIHQVPHTIHAKYTSWQM